jgi:hypothetical protein
VVFGFQTLPKTQADRADMGRDRAGMGSRADIPNHPANRPVRNGATTCDKPVCTRINWANKVKGIADHTARIVPANDKAYDFVSGGLSQKSSAKNCLIGTM